MPYFLSDDKWHFILTLVRNYKVREEGRTTAVSLSTYKCDLYTKQLHNKQFEMEWKANKLPRPFEITRFVPCYEEKSLKVPKSHNNETKLEKSSKQRCLICAFALSLIFKMRTTQFPSPEGNEWVIFCKCLLWSRSADSYLLHLRLRQQSLYLSM